MAADVPYFDTSYLVRLYLRDHGFEAVRERASSAASIASAWHAQAEITAALHRSFREGRLQQGVYLRALDQFIAESNDGLFVWLPLTDPVQQRVEQFYQTAPATVFCGPPTPCTSPARRSTAIERSTRTTATSSPPLRSSVCAAST